jgi:hypothetical protein
MNFHCIERLLFFFENPQIIYAKNPVNLCMVRHYVDVNGVIAVSSAHKLFQATKLGYRLTKSLKYFSHNNLLLLHNIM